MNKVHCQGGLSSCESNGPKRILTKSGEVKDSESKKWNTFLFEESEDPIPGSSPVTMAEDFLPGHGEEEGGGGVGADIRKKDKYGFEDPNAFLLLFLASKK